MEELGKLSSKHESGSRGSTAIGWDSRGGASYGRFQIATKVGTMGQFLVFCSRRYRDVYDRLFPVKDSMGELDGAFARTWVELAEQGRIKEPEYEFVKATHYLALLDQLNIQVKAAVDRFDAMKEVMWSVSVQHGATDPDGDGPRIGRTAKYINKAWRNDAADMIRSIYAWRRTQFGAHREAVQKAVRRRFEVEQAEALGMLKEEMERKR